MDVQKFSIHFWGTSSISGPQLWRDSLLFKGFQYYFRSMHPLNWSHIWPTGVIPMLSLCKTWIDVLKFSIHFWGTSSYSVPQLWRDSLLFNGFKYYFHSMHPLNEVTSGQHVLYRCFHCARLESMYWNSVSTLWALLQFQYHSCEEIVYFSRDFSTTFVQCIH